MFTVLSIPQLRGVTSLAGSTSFAGRVASGDCSPEAPTNPQGWLPITSRDSLPATGPALPDGIGYPQGSLRKVSSLWLSCALSFLVQYQFN